MSSLINFLLFGLAIVVLPFGISPFETPKIIVAELGILVLMVLVLGQKKWFSGYRLGQLGLIGGVLVWSIVGLIFNHGGAGFLGNSFRLQGVFLLWLLLIFSLVCCRVGFVRSPRWVLLGLIILELLAVVLVQVPSVDRAVGTLGEPNALAAYIVFLWPFLVWTSSKSKWLIFLSISLAAVIIFLSGSRSGLIAFLIQLVFVSLGKFKIGIDRVTLISVCLIIFSLALPFVDQRQEYESRAEIWKTAFVAGFYHPLVGGGFGNTQKLLTDARAILGVNREFQVIDSSHNLLLDFWVQGGVIGVVLIISLIALALRDFIRARSQLGVMLLLGLVTVAMFNPLSIVSLIQFWWLLGGSRVESR